MNLSIKMETKRLKTGRKSPQQIENIFAKSIKMLRQIEPGIMRKISKLTGDPRHADMSPQKINLTFKTEPIHKQVKQKDDRLNRKQVLGRIKGHQLKMSKQVFHLSHVPTLPIRHLNDVQNRIWFFFQDPAHDKEVLKRSLLQKAIPFMSMP